MLKEIVLWKLSQYESKFYPQIVTILKEKQKAKISLLESCQVVWSMTIQKEAKLNRNQLACNKKWLTIII